MVTLNTEATLDTAHEDVDERGFGVVEIVVSMLLIGLLAIAFLPLLVQTLKVSQVNTTTATATQLLERELDAARKLPGSCAALNSFAAATPVVKTDPRGVVMTPTRAATCSVTVFPATVALTVTITTPNASNPLAPTVISRATMLLLVTGA